MQWLNQIAQYQPLLKQLLLIFSLVVARVGGLMMMAPIYGSRDVPIHVRSLLVVALAILITPTQLGVVIDEPAKLASVVLEPDQRIGPIDWGTDSGEPVNLVNYSVKVVGETLIGLALGLAIMLLFVGVQVIGQVIGQMSGMAIANVLNPTFESNVALLSQFLHVTALAIFVAMGGHRLVMEALLDTFVTIPLGTGGLSTSVGEAIITVLTQAFTFGIRAAAPIVTSLLLSTMVLGLIGRTMPQMNILAIGFGLNSMIMLTTLSLSLGAIGWIFQEQITVAIDTVMAGLHEGVAGSYP